MIKNTIQYIGVLLLALLPEKVDGKYTWQIGFRDTDVLAYDPKTKKLSLEVYDYINDDYEIVDTLPRDQAYKVAMDAGIIY